MIEAVAQLGDAGNGLAPRQGESYLVLSTGIAGSTNTDVVVGGSAEEDVFTDNPHKMHDAAEVALDLVAPNGATGFSLDYLFLSQQAGISAQDAPKSDKFYILVEDPETGVAQVVNGGLCTSDVADKQTLIEGTTCETPADCPVGATCAGLQCHLLQCYISVNSQFFAACDVGEAPIDLGGSGYSCADGGSSTRWLRTQSILTSGQKFTLRLHIHDTAGPNEDSSVIIDNFRWLSGPQTYGTTVLP